jgi:hypothetical protein
MKSLGLMQFIFEFFPSLGCGFQTFWADFYRLIKIFFTPRFLTRKPAREVAFHSGAVAFQSGPDAKKNGDLKGSSASQIASLILNKK